ncbi:UNVERIFIED_CONTAM: AAA ATPase-like protein [Williamsia faeni]
MTSVSPLEALTRARSGFSNSAHTRDDVWISHNDIHVDGLHAKAWRAIERAVADAQESRGPSPLGVVLQGQAGTGKTHLLGQIREYVQGHDGYFVMLDLLDPSDFWRTLLSSLLDSLNRQIAPPVDKTQLHDVMQRLADLAGTSRVARRAISGETLITPTILDEFVGSLRKPLPALIRSHHATLRALVLSAAPSSRLNDLGIAYLENNIDEIDPAERTEWQLPPRALPYEQTVRAISEYMAVTGPTVLAIDQIDTLIAQSRSGTDAATSAGSYADVVVDLVAHGLMSVREVLLRTVCVVSCLPSVWTIIENQATATVPDRFHANFVLQGLPDGAFARTLVERRLSKSFAASGFTPPYPTWPVQDQAFAAAASLTARRLIKRIDRHINDCLDNEIATELASLADESTIIVKPPRPPKNPDLDEVYERHIRNALTASAVDPKKEDDVIPALLNAGLRAWAVESGSDDFTIDYVGGQYRLHARLRLILDAFTDDEQHWAFRAISATNPKAVQSRLRNASIDAGLSSSVPRRQLFILRNIEWPGGPKTTDMVNEFTANGGQVLAMSFDDLARLSALNEMTKAMPAGFDAWLRSHRPAHQIEFLKIALTDAGTITERAPESAVDIDWINPEPPAPEPHTAEPQAAELDTPGEPTPERFAEITTEIPVYVPDDHRDVPVSPAAEAPTINLGISRSGTTASVDLEALRKHTVIFAGSGSGKTVMIRRLIEECALQGVSAIVLDPNNDLARLGTAWPEAPSGWSGDDAAKAVEYIDTVETVIWTPRLNGGRPLSFQPLPDFEAVQENPDEFDLAVDAAVSALKPYAGVSGAKAALQEAILKRSMALYGRKGGGSLGGYVGLLSEMTDDMSGLTDTEKLAGILAENLKAAMIINPMLGGGGTPVDPSVLLTPTAGKRARISVISLIGLPDESNRQGFVNQLELALFAWIKKNPAGDRPLGALFVMDEAQTLVPSGRVTACTRSTVALASQARKYGLGLVFATQAPKGIDAKIVGNASTQFFGRLNTPVQINAANEMASAKGSRINDIGRLGTGEFYVAPDGASFQKVNTPLCLSYHPSSPLSDEEVVALSRQ